MTNDQRFVLLLLIGLASGAWLSASTTAQTFSSEDRGSILKFMDVLMNFLDAETENGTSTESPNGNDTTTTETSNATDSSTISTSQSSESTEATSSNSTTLATNATESSSSSSSTNSSTTDATSTTSSSPVATTRRRICFRRVCYKFMNDKGYIY
ncbi:uncharacterized protein LOC117566258 [Drosophila albomicans]|uniref:Uncharacterized protein LOC117566258 n=1 Tax=Drosophila albomicans TaxID=7291 RepID=A0A9C6WEW1_DROAB|nr:uncharacterized protein LOC117566258 [Drosophila albomicans]